jgi:hypothetical protein
MAKSSRKAAARKGAKGTSAASRAAGSARGASASGRAARAGSASKSSGASRWSRGKPVPKRKPASDRPVRVTAAPLAIRDPSHEEIAHHAYMRWLAHGGSEHDNWLAAEHELRTRRNTLRARGSAKGRA